MRRGINFAHDYGLARDGAVFGPALLVASLAATAIGGAATAASTLAGGSMAQQAGDVTKTVMANEGATAFASGQRQALDTTQRSKLLQSTAIARAAASGVDAGTGSPLNTVGEIAQRGSYQSLMDMFNGQSRGDALRYQGEEAAWEGNMKKNASYLSAAGTLAGTAGSMMGTYGGFKYPTNRGGAGTNF